MDTTSQVVVLFWVSIAVVGVGGVVSGLVVYHCALGWFISRCSKETLESAVERAEVHCQRRAQRRHEAERRRRLLRAAGVESGGRHLAR